MGDITFIKGQGGLLKPLPGEDHISGLIFYHNTLPSGFGSTDRIKEITDVPAAEALGIIDDKSDEVKATGANVLILQSDASGGNVEILLADESTNEIKIDGVTIGNFTAGSGDDEDDIAAGLRLSINNAVSGYTAAGAGHNVLLTPPPGLGASINGGTHVSFTSAGAPGHSATTATVTQFSGGVGAGPGDTETISMDGVVLGSYTVLAGDLEDDIALGLETEINLLTYTHGYSATINGANVGLVAPDGLGDSINGGTHITYLSTGTGASTITQFSGGVDAFFDVIHYHLSEMFRVNPGVKLYVGIFDVPQGWTFDELETMQNFTIGKIRQVGIFLKDVVFAAGHMSQIQTVLNTLDTLHKPISSVLYAADISGVTNLTTLSDLAALTNEKVSAIIGQDGANTGAALYTEKGYSITCLGAALGAVSLAAVNQNIGWVRKFNMSDGNELEEPAIANGTLMNTLSSNAITAIDVKNYIFLKKHIGATGTYFNDSWTAVARTSDYGNIEANRTMDKAIRGVRFYVLPEVNAPVYVDPSTGKLAIDYVKYLESIAGQALTEMESAKELSGWKVVIDPAQNVLSTSQIDITIVNVPVGVSRNIKIKISYSTQI